MQKCLWRLRREIQGTLSMCYALKNNIRLLMIHCCLVNNYDFIIRWVFIAPEFYLLLRDMVHTVTVYSSLFLSLIWDKTGANVSSRSAYCTASFSQRVRVMTGSNVRPTLGWYMLCLRPVPPQRAYGRRRWHFTSVLSPLPTNWAEANTVVFNWSDILIHGFVLVFLKVTSVRFSAFRSSTRI